VRDPSVSGHRLPVASLIGNRELLLALCLLSNVFAGLISTLMAAYLPDAVAELAGSMDATTVGHVGAYVGSLFLAGWAVGGVAFGMAADRYGRARTFSAAVILFSAASIAASVSASWPILVACRLATGVGIGGTMVVSAILVAEAYAERARAIALGFMGVTYPLGIIAAGAVSYAVTNWRTGFLIGVVPMALGAIGILTIRDSAHWLTEYTRRSDPLRRTGLGTLVSPEHRKDFLLGATIFGTMSIGLWATFSWLPAWAESLIGPAGGGGQQQRGMLMMVLGGGGIVGGAISGFLSNALGRRRTLLIAFAGAFAGSMLLFQTNSVFSALVFAETALLAIFFGISQGTLTGYIPELFPTGIRATATGICFNVGRVATAGAVFFVGVMVPVLGGYGSSISIFAVMYLVGFVATLQSKETRSSSERTPVHAPGQVTEHLALPQVPGASPSVAATSIGASAPAGPP
jgi:MFS family permease